MDSWKHLQACSAATAAAAIVAIVGYRLLRTDNAGLKKESEIKKGVTELIGNTPLVRINSLSEATGCEVLGKCEFLNPGGSSKDRIALYLIEQAEKRGDLEAHTGSCIFEGTSGSTGISLAMVACAKGYKCHIVMPSDQAIEKSQLLERHGAHVERVVPCSIVDDNHFVNIARRRAQEYGKDDPPGGLKRRGFFVDQFENPLNCEAHYRTTGPEILRQTGGKVDVFVHGSGTGGTIAGVTHYLKRQVPGVQCFLADPQGSGLANKVNYGVMFAATEREGTRRRQQVDTLVEGVGLNRLTRNFARLLLPERCLLDGAVSVSDGDAVCMARWLMANDGLFVGSSAAINCVAALEIARRLGPGHTIVTVLADSGQRHLTKFWNDDAMAALGHSVAAPSALADFPRL
ncbi:Cysteine synthase 2 [Coemansia sp. RSA 1813]|nr:Cysteine synthase 2 [Coemansia sp. RSA 1646]KAJ1769064.1 Cysteine synthase 2 [Coemansia sp. RSA 1843]KAJ2211676.1 Cysteine synthase 2 [Coemansia sp. RSA 487]KAJ2565371.1 Cysteine synthase 2 [Coemansia sp. RSA 1813]